MQLLDCWVELTWPASHGIRWNAHQTGADGQIRPALDELAVWVGHDALTQVILRVDPSGNPLRHLRSPA